MLRALATGYSVYFNPNPNPGPNPNRTHQPNSPQSTVERPPHTRQAVKEKVARKSNDRKEGRSRERTGGACGSLDRASEGAGGAGGTCDAGVDAGVRTGGARCIAITNGNGSAAEKSAAPIEDLEDPAIDAVRASRDLAETEAIASAGFADSKRDFRSGGGNPVRLHGDSPPYLPPQSQTRRAAVSKQPTMGRMHKRRGEANACRRLLQP